MRLQLQPFPGSPSAVGMGRDGCSTTCRSTHRSTSLAPARLATRANRSKDGRSLRRATDAFAHKRIGAGIAAGPDLQSRCAFDYGPKKVMTLFMRSMRSAPPVAWSEYSSNGNARKTTL